MYLENEEETHIPISMWYILKKKVLYAKYDKTEHI